MESNLSREERIKKYAYEWYLIRKANNARGDSNGDWLRGEHMVNGEDWAEQLVGKHESS
jgi:hypothetical protein